MAYKKNSKGIHQLFAGDPEKADLLLWGRVVNPVSRRGFLKKSGLLTLSGVLGAQIPFADNMPGGLIPAALAGSHEPFKIPGKDPGLIVWNDRPLTAETPPDLLDDPITPADKLFIRNNGIPPQNIDPEKWMLEIGGESASNIQRFSLEDLKNRFPHYSYQLVVECAGNGRNEFNPSAGGTQWSVGAVACPTWTGVRVKDVLQATGIKEDAVYIGYYGRDTDLSGDPDKTPISRGVPIAKVMQEETLIAWAVNGRDIPLMNGFPLRLVCGGWPGSTSGKWLEKIVVRNKVHDGAKMTGFSYRVPCHRAAPGSQVDVEDMCIIESMPVKSLITYPRTGAMIKQKDSLLVRGHAWAGELSVKAMEVSIDFGVTWQSCHLRPPVNRLAWQQWHVAIDFPEQGYYEVWARATDSAGSRQPMVVPGWNPGGYLNNACHRIAVMVV